MPNNMNLQIGEPWEKSMYIYKDSTRNKESVEEGPSQSTKRPTEF